jgi:hypothetical protein
MGREYEAERLFCAQLDRLLAGEDVVVRPDETYGEPDGTYNDDLRSALDFARKMAGLRVVPDPRFSAGLKARLLQELQEKEERRAAGQGWSWRWLGQLFPSRPLFQAVTVLAVVLIVSGILWATVFRPTQELMVSGPGKTPPAAYGPIATTPPATTMAAPAAPTAVASATSAPVPAPSSAPPAPGLNVYLSASASTDKAAYQPGETVRIQVSLKNIASQPVTLKEFPPLLSLMQSDTRQPVYTFQSGKLSRTIPPGETVNYSLTWDQLDARGRHVSPGGYFLELEEVYRQGLSMPMDLASPVYFQVLPPPSSTGGAGRPVEGLNRPLTMSGITVTLQHLELTERGVTISAFNSPPPDYVLKQDSTGLNPTIDYRTQARFSVDGSWFEKTQPSLVEYFAGGMKQSWFLPLSSPDQVSKLDFILDNIAGWQGPWEFVITLK